MNAPRFPPDVAAGIVAHMNEDHADAVLAICRAYGRPLADASGATGPDARDATGARLLAIAPAALEIEYAVAGASGRASVAFEPPIEPPDTVRARLVSMTRSARACLAARPAGPTP